MRATGGSQFRTDSRRSGLADKACSSLPSTGDNARIELLVRASRIMASRPRPVAPVPLVPPASPAPEALLFGLEQMDAWPSSPAEPSLQSWSERCSSAYELTCMQPGGCRHGVDRRSAVDVFAAPAEDLGAPRLAKSSAPSGRTTPHIAKKLASHFHPSKSGLARRFVWAPVADTTGYRVNFFRGSQLVFSSDMSRPEIPISPSWASARASARRRVPVVSLAAPPRPACAERRCPGATHRARLIGACGRHGIGSLLRGICARC